MADPVHTLSHSKCCQFVLLSIQQTCTPTQFPYPPHLFYCRIKKFCQSDAHERLFWLLLYLAYCRQLEKLSSTGFLDKELHGRPKLCPSFYWDICLFLIDSQLFMCYMCAYTCPHILWILILLSCYYIPSHGRLFSSSSSSSSFSSWENPGIAEEMCSQLINSGEDPSPSHLCKEESLKPDICYWRKQAAPGICFLEAL